MHSAINSVLYIGFLILLLISLTYEPVAAFDPHPPHQVFDFNKHALEPLIRDAEQKHQLHDALKGLRVPAPVRPYPGEMKSPNYRLTPLWPQPFHSPVPPSSPNYKIYPGGFGPTFKVPTLPRR